MTLTGGIVRLQAKRPLLACELMRSMGAVMSPESGGAGGARGWKSVRQEAQASLRGLVI